MKRSAAVASRLSKNLSRATESLTAIHKGANHQIHIQSFTRNSLQVNLILSLSQQRCHDFKKKIIITHFKNQQIRSYSTSKDSFFSSNTPSIDTVNKGSRSSSSQSDFRAVFLKRLNLHLPSTEPELLELIKQAQRVSGEKPGELDWEIGTKVLLGWQVSQVTSDVGKTEAEKDSKSKKVLSGKGRATGIKLEPEIISLENGLQYQLSPPDWFQQILSGLHLPLETFDPTSTVHQRPTIEPSSLNEGYLLYQACLKERDRSCNLSESINLLIKASCSTFLPNLDLAFSLYDELRSRNRNRPIQEDIYATLLFTCVRIGEMERIERLFLDLKKDVGSLERWKEDQVDRSQDSKLYSGLGAKARTSLVLNLISKSRNFKESWEIYSAVFNLGRLFAEQRINPESSEKEILLESQEESKQETQWFGNGTGPFHYQGWVKIIERFMKLKFPSGNSNDRDLEASKLIAQFIPPKSWIRNLTPSRKEEEEEKSLTREIEVPLSPAPPELFLFLLRDMTTTGHPPSNQTYSQILNYYASQCEFARSSTSYIHNYQTSILNLHSLLKADVSLNPDMILITSLMKAYSFSGLHEEVFKIWFSLISTKSQIDGPTLSVFLDTCAWNGKVGLREARKGMEFCRKFWPESLNKGAMDSWVECLCRRGRVLEASKVVFEEYHQDEVEVKTRIDQKWKVRIGKDSFPGVDLKLLQVLLKFAARERDYMESQLKSQDHSINIKSDLKSESNVWSPGSKSSSQIKWKSESENYQGQKSIWHFVRNNIKELYPWLWDEVKDIGVGNEKDLERRLRERRD